ncbi:conserved Plasmodium protein, unknown function [Plasmodium chabaudi adami]|uniref:AP2-coincident C-terminal domain-containing protein n=1 Tax=Plasmodium chabaudi adami TaxID=5826 RepID=A0A1C6YMW1_PLACE|nr:conserved Plasmodium protein, unknown function [Plasmodium chabaudi adami]
MYVNLAYNKFIYNIIKEKRNDEKYVKIYEKRNSVGKRNNFNSKIFRYTNNKRSTNKSISIHNIDNNIKDTIQDIIKVNTYYNVIERNKYYTSVDEKKKLLSQSEDFCMQNNMNLFCNEQDILKTNNVMENESMANNNSKGNNDDIKINNNYNHINIINANNKNINTNISMINIPITCSALKKYIYYDMSNSKKENGYIIKNEKDISNTFDHTENQRCNDGGVENKYATSYDGNYENSNENSSSNCHDSSSGSDKWNCNSNENETYNKNNSHINEFASSQLEHHQNIFQNNCKEVTSNKRGSDSLELCTNLAETCEDNYSEDREKSIESSSIIIKETLNNEDISEREVSKASTLKKMKEICKNIYVSHRKGSNNNVKIKRNKKKDINFKEKINDMILCQGENLSNEIIEERQKSEKNTIPDNCSPCQMENRNNNNIFYKQIFDASIGKSTTNTYCELSDRMLTATTSAEKSSENLSNTNNEHDEKVVYSNSPLNNHLYSTYLHPDGSPPLSDILCNDICHKNDDRTDGTNADMATYLYKNNIHINTNNTTINSFNSNNSGNTANIIRKDKLEESQNENGKNNINHDEVSKNETNLQFSCDKNFNNNDGQRNKDEDMINEINFYDKKKSENGEIVIKKENVKRNLNCDLDHSSKKKPKINEHSVINLNAYKNHQYDIYKNNSYNAYILKNLRNVYLRNKLKEQQEGLEKVKKQEQRNKLDKKVEQNLSYDNYNNKIFDNNDENFYYENKKFTINQNEYKENRAIINKKTDKKYEQIKGMNILENENVKDEIMSDTHNSNNINIECVSSIYSGNKNADRKNNSLKGLNLKNYSNTSKGSYDPKFVNENLLKVRKEKCNNTNLNLFDIINLLEKEKIENLYSENELKYILFPIYDIYYDNKSKSWIYKIENEKNTLNDKENKKNGSTKNSSYHKSRQLALERKYNYIKEKYNIFANLSEEENIFFISINMHTENNQTIKNKPQNLNEESSCFKEMNNEIGKTNKDDIFKDEKNINTKEQPYDQKKQPSEIEKKNQEYTNSSNESTPNLNEVLNNKDYNINKENLTDTINILNNEVSDKISKPLLLPNPTNENKSNISYNGIETIDKTTEMNITSEDNIENEITPKSKEGFVYKKENSEHVNANDEKNLNLSEKDDDKMFNSKTESILYKILGIRLSNNVIEKMRNLQKQNIFYERDKKRWVIKILEKETNTLLYFKKFDCKVFGFAYACILTIEYKNLYLDYFLNEKNYDFLMKLIHNNYIKKNTHYNTGLLNSLQENQLNAKDIKIKNNYDNATYEEASLRNANHFSPYTLEENKTHSNLYIEKKKKKNSGTLILNNDAHDLYNKIKNIENENTSLFENPNLLNDVDCANYKKNANIGTFNGCNLERESFSSNRQESENKEAYNTEIQNYETCNSDTYNEHDYNNDNTKDGGNFIEHMQTSENATNINSAQSREIIKGKKQKSIRNVKDVTENFTVDMNGVQIGKEKKKKKKNYSLSVNKNNGNEVYASNNDAEQNLIEDSNINETPKPNDTTNEAGQIYNDKINNHKKTNENIKKMKKVKNSSLFKKTKNIKDTSQNPKENNNNNNYTSELALEETNNLIKLDSYVDNLERNSDVISLAKLTILLLLKDIINCIPSQMAPSVISRKIYDQKINAHVKFVYQCKNLIELMPYFFIFKNIIKQKTLPSDQSLYICNVLLYALFEA